jgi:hypothetical protein
VTLCNIHPGEEWRTVPGASRYEVSDRGRFRKDGGDPTVGRPHNRGYRQVSYTRDDGRYVTRTVHTLLLEAFRGPCPPGLESCHLDDVPTHNCLENLERNTHPVNVRQRMENHPAAPPKTKRICVMCRERPVTRGGKRCHECVVWLGEQAAGEYLHKGRSILEACDELDYPSAEGLQRLAERYGGYGVPPLPADDLDDYAGQHLTWLQRVTVFATGWRR